MNQTVLIDAHDGGSFSAYLSSPPSKRGPALVLLQYIFGVNKVMRDLADYYASLGYLVIVPDLFWRQEPNVRLADDPARATQEEQQKAMELNAGFNDDMALLDLAATRQFVLSHEYSTGKVGVLGYCLGGRMGYRMAAHLPLDCAVSYYGVNLEHYLDEGLRIECPTLMHMAGNDFLVPDATRQQIIESLRANSAVRFEVYPGVNHAFALKGGANYNAQAAHQADQKSIAFLRQHLPLAV